MAERPGERPAESLDRVVTGLGRRLVDLCAVAEPPGGTLEHHAPAQGDRRLACASAELPGEVERRGVGGSGHVAEVAVALVQNCVEQLSQAVSAVVRHSSSLAAAGVRCP
jgi:hypothetical protein